MALVKKKRTKAEKKEVAAKALKTSAEVLQYIANFLKR